MWVGRAISAFGCPEAFVNSQIRFLQPATISAAMDRGKAVHKVIERSFALRDATPVLVEKEAFAVAFQETSQKIQDAKTQYTVLAMTGHAWDVYKSAKVSHVEAVINWEAPSGNVWRIKPDAIQEEENGLWLLEWKSTAQYGNTVRRRYHREMQPWVYIYVLRQHGLNIQGVKINVLMEREMITEPIAYTDGILEVARQFMIDAELRIAEHFEAYQEGHVFKDRSKCVGIFGECPYLPICEPLANPDYIEGLKKNLYRIQDPEDHLKEDAP